MIYFNQEKHYYYKIEEIEKTDKKGNVSVINKEVRIPGVSTIINATMPKHGLVEWAAKTAAETAGSLLLSGESDIQVIVDAARRSPESKKNEAAFVGTLVHSSIELLLEGRDYSHIIQQADESCRVEFDTCWNNFMTCYDKLRKEGYNFIANEIQVYSEKHNYSGRFDGLVEKKGKRYIIDWKTSKSLYDSHIVQAAAYAIAYREQFGGRELGIIIAHIPIDGEPSMIIIPPGQTSDAKRLFKTLVKQYVDAASVRKHLTVKRGHYIKNIAKAIDDNAD